MKYNILFLENDLHYQDIIVSYFKDSNIQIIACDNITKAKMLCERNKIDLFLLDWKLDLGSAHPFLAWIKKQIQYEKTPCLVLSSFQNHEDVLKALNSGALDYVNKADSNVLELLKIKLNNHLVHNKLLIKNNNIVYKDITINPNTREITIENKVYELRETPFKILFLLLQNPNKIFSRKELNNIILGENIFVNDRNIDTHIVEIRKKFYPISMIKSVYGKGYRVDYHN